MTIKNVTFIGLGVMGFPMAGHLKNNNFNVTVFNRTTSKADSWIKKYQGFLLYHEKIHKFGPDCPIMGVRACPL